MNVLPDNPPPTPWKQGPHDLHGHFATVRSCETLRSLVCSRPSFDHIKERSGKRRCDSSPGSPPGVTRWNIWCPLHSGRRGLGGRGAVSHGLIIPLIIQTIRWDPSGPDAIDAPPDLSRADPSGADQIDAEHQATEVVDWQPCSIARAKASQAPLRLGPAGLRRFSLVARLELEPLDQCVHRVSVGGAILEPAD
jgi:hypothetical protein